MAHGKRLRLRRGPSGIGGGSSSSGGSISSTRGSSIDEDSMENRNDLLLDCC